MEQTLTSQTTAALLAGHTLVIPTYNRPDLLKQLAIHFTRTVPAMQILVLDSSRPEIAALNGAALAGLSATLRHVVYDTTTHMARKLALGLAEVATPTASFCADDDLVFADGIAEAIQFLADNPDYVTAHGLYLNFLEDGTAIRLTREYAGPGNEAQHAGARIFRLCQNYESLFYGVFRTPDLRDIFNEVADIPTLHYQELFQSAGALIKGKVKRFATFYAGRRTGPAAEPERDKWQTFYWFADNPGEVMQHYVAYRERLGRFYQRFGATPQLDGTAFNRSMDLAHMVYLARGCPPAYFHEQLQAYWPGDAYERVEDIDLFQQFSSPGALRYLALIQSLTTRVWRRMVAVLANLTERNRGDLDRQVARDFKTTWSCQPGYGLAWLAGHAGFRVAYRQLCNYLDIGRHG